MSTTIISKQLIRRGDLLQMPFLSAGEFGLAKDEQRLFLGQEPIVGTLNTVNSDATVAYVDFPTKFNAASKSVDVDKAYQGSYKIVITDDQGVTTDILASNINTDSDGMFYFPHGLGVVPSTETFTFYWNKEITSYVDDDGSLAGLKAIELTKQNPAGSPDSTNVAFHSDVKNKIELEYTLSISGTDDIRSGTLEIFIQGATTSTIKDSYSMSSTALDVDFSLDALNKEFTLMYDTTYVGSIIFNYIEKSFETLKSV